MKLLVDMNLSPGWVQALAACGFASAHWSTVGEYGATDATIMDYAAIHDFVVLTHDLDFGAILAATRGAKPSVVQVRSEDVRPSVIAKLLVRAIKQVQAELEAGALLTVDPGRTRLRLLPLRLKD